MSKSHKDSINDIKSDLDSSSNKQMLGRKKKRDPNISSEIFDLNSSSNETRCSICLGEEKLVPNCYKCKTCSAFFHIECYNLFTFAETKEEKISIEDMNDFECFRCKEEKEIKKEIKCFACKAHSGIIKKYAEEKYLHHYCYVFFKDGFDMLKGGICKMCGHKKIPVLKCQEIKCKEKFHIQCAIDKKIIFWLPFMREEEKINEEKFNEKIPFLCDEHNKALIDNFAEYSQTMLLSKNDKNEPEKNNEQIDEKQNNDNNNNEKQLSPQKIPEKENNNIINNEVKNEINMVKEEKAIEKEKIINTVININVTKETKSDNNLININKSMRNISIKEEKEKDKEKEKEKNNSNNNIMIQSKNSENINLSSKKIDLSSKNPSKVLSNSFYDKPSGNLSNLGDIDVDIKINVEENEDDDDEEYDPPEINYDEVDLFENFKNKNSKFMIPGSFYKLHM